MQRIGVANCETVALIDLQSLVPQAAIELNPEVSDFFRIIEKVRSVDLLGGGLNKDVWEVSAAPSGLSDGARAFYRNDHEDAFRMARRAAWLREPRG